MKCTEAGTAVGDERTHAQLVGERERPAIEVGGATRTCGVVADGDIGEGLEGERLVRALIVLGGQFDGASRAFQGFFPAPDAQICRREPRRPNREPQSHRADRRFLVERVFEERKSLAGTPGQCVGIPEAREQIHVCGALWPNERQATLEREPRTIQFAALEMDAAESTVRFDERVEVIRRFGDAQRFFCVVRRVLEATEMAEREPQPGMGPGLEEAWWNAERSWAIGS